MLARPRDGSRVRRPEASGAVFTSMAPGLIIGPVAAGAARDALESYAWCFRGCALCWGLAFLLSFRLPPAPRGALLFAVCRESGLLSKSARNCGEGDRSGDDGAAERAATADDAAAIDALFKKEEGRV